MGVNPLAADTEAVGPQVAVLFVGVSLFVGMASRHLLKNTSIPYTVALLILGIGLGSLEYGTTNGLGVLGDSIRMWASIDPNLILFVFLPALLFESSFAMDFHQIKRGFMQMLLLAAPGVVISTIFLGVVLKILPYHWNWSTGFLLGGLLSATDPVAVVALLKELGASKKLSTLIEGESLMNDGTVIVVFHLFLQIVLGQKFSSGDVISFLCRVGLGAVGLGLLFGIVCVCWVGLVFNDTIIEITLTFTASYLAFFMAEEKAHVSGVLTVMTVGIFFAAFARTAFTGESERSMFHFWELISYIANTLIFVLSGAVIAESILRSHDKIEGRDWSNLLLLYIFVQFSRVVVVGLLYPGLKFFGYGMSWKEATILIWAGLRGAVALSLSLSVARVGQHDAHTHFTKVTEARFVFLTGGVVFLTLVINGSTTQFLFRFLNMNNTTETKTRILEFVKYEMYSNALEAFGEMGEDEELGPADWITIRKYLSCLSSLPEDGEPAHPHGPPGSEGSGIEYVEQQMQDTRIRFLNGVQAAYWSMLEEGRITQTAARILIQSIHEALDQVENYSGLQDWEGLRSHVRFSWYLEYLSLLPRRASTFFLIAQLEFACYIAAAFLRAHRMTRNYLRDFIGESFVAEAVIHESEAQGQEARQFLDDIRLAFPQVLRAVKTKQVTHAVLVHLTEYVRSLGNAGLLESKERLQLHDAVQIDLKKLLRNPPIVEMPTVWETLHNQPFIGALPVSVQRPLLDVAKEFMMVQSTIIYEEDKKPDGIWLIANGVVQCNSKATNGQQLHQPTFSLGSTLGLFEALTGRPYLCDIVTRSVVHCFFIERSKILSVQKEHPELEDFLWQESALAIAKVVLAKEFEKATLQDIRALMMEGSSMRIFLRGEVFELQPKKIGVLLDGFVRPESSFAIITAPAGLMRKVPLPSSGDFTRNSLKEGTVFHAEARSRILFFDMDLWQGSGQFLAVPHKDCHSSLRRSLIEHDTPRVNGHQSAADIYSAKALEISVFGSQIEGNSESWREEERPGNVLSRTHQSCSNLVKRMSMVMQGRPSNDKWWTSRHKVASQGKMDLVQPFLHKKETDPGYSSDESDGEHIVKIGSLSALFYPSHPHS